MAEILAIVWGLVIGSFLNVCICRLPEKKSLIRPASHCLSCGSKIRFYHNIPVLSFVFLKGRCASCNQKISWQYPIVEILSALTTLAVLLHFGLVWDNLFYLLLIYSLIVVAFIDLKHGMIYNRILIFILAAGLILNLVFQIMPWQSAALGLVAGSGSLWLFAQLGQLLFHKESLGMGDVKLAGVAGFFLGIKLILVALYAGFVLALIIITGIKLWKNQPIVDRIPMGPFLGAALIVFTIWGEQIIEYYLALFV
jgi:leader peptidase (prepilin peptidase)/N-methyltransferase